MASVLNKDKIHRGTVLQLDSPYLGYLCTETKGAKFADIDAKLKRAARVLESLKAYARNRK